MSLGKISKIALPSNESSRPLENWLLDAFADGLVENIGAAGPLPGHELPWGEWLATVRPDINQPLMASEHMRLWEWIDGIVPGTRPLPFLGVWPRGYGKTTTARLAMARTCVKLSRRFGLYVCATQVTANNHIISIRNQFERLGIQRAENDYGVSLGWSAQRLTTQNGFTLVALGLDQSNIRGLNLHDLRPDLIVLDDIDDLKDTVEAAAKKLDIIVSTVIPAGSNDRAVLFVQNEIHANSVMAQMVSGEAGALRNRVLSKTVAIEGLKIGRKPNPEPGGIDLLTIQEGRSTWPGKSLADWEADLNESTEDAFLRECQGRLGAGGLFFSQFQRQRVNPLTGELEDWHVCDMPTVAPWDMFHAAHDYGTTAAACTGIAHIDQWGIMTLIGEVYGADRTSKQQALHAALWLSRVGLCSAPPCKLDSSVPGGIEATDTDKQEQPLRFAVNHEGNRRLKLIAFDYANTFTPVDSGNNAITRMVGEYPIEVWRRYGLPVVPADKDIIAGFRNFKDALSETVTLPKEHPTMPGRTVPRFRIARGAAPMTEEYLASAMTDPTDERKAIARAKLEHAGDMARYLCMTRHKAAQTPPPEQFNLPPQLRTDNESNQRQYIR
jgi:hypothetical protein